MTHPRSIHGLHESEFDIKLIISNTVSPLVLDPRISYKGMRSDYTDNPTLSEIWSGNKGFQGLLRGFKGHQAVSRGLMFC